MTGVFVLPFNDGALRGNTAFIPVDIANVGSRAVAKYLLHNPGFEALNRAVESILTFLRDNPMLCATFHTVPIESLRDEISRKRYLTVNGRAVSIHEDFAEGVAAYRDFFTEAPVTTPIRCPQGHTLERDLTEVWVQSNGDVCPAGDHAIGPLVANPELVRDAILHKRASVEAAQQRDSLMCQQRLLSLQNRIIAVVNRLIQERDTTTTRIMVGDSGKIFIKGGLLVLKTTCQKSAKDAAELTAKEFAQSAALQVSKGAIEKVSKEATEQVAKRFKKLIPGACIVMGAGMAYARFSHHQYVRGIGEFASGVIGCFPGWGQGISLGLDVVLLAADITEAAQSSSAPAAIADPTPQNVSFDLPGAYQILGINIPNPNPAEDRIDVDDAHRWLTALTHVNHFGTGAVPPEWQVIMDIGARAIDNARQTIYQSKSWA